MNCLKYIEMPKLLTREEKASLGAMAYFEQMNARGQINQRTGLSAPLGEVSQERQSKTQKGERNAPLDG